MCPTNTRHRWVFRRPLRFLPASSETFPIRPLQQFSNTFKCDIYVSDINTIPPVKCN